MVEPHMLHLLGVCYVCPDQVSKLDATVVRLGIHFSFAVELMFAPKVSGLLDLWQLVW